MAKPDTTPNNHHHHRGQTAWGTWDELLLACAVKKHGFKAWDSVAMELQSRTSLPHPLTTAHHCELKYRDLKRRFSSSLNADGPEDDDSPAAVVDSGDKVDAIPWLDELRRLRVAELRQELQQYDVSISSLQLKVKKLEEEREEREESVREDQRSQHQQEPDPATDSKDNRSENDKAAAAGEPDASVPEKTADKSAAGEESDRENRSVNGSNSTGVKSEPEKMGREPEPKAEEGEEEEEDDEPARPETGSDKTDRVSNESNSRPEGVDSYNGSSEPNPDRTVDESEELPESKENSSDVQSSASLTKKRKKGKGRRMEEISGTGRDGELPETEEASPVVNLAGVKSQPLVDILKMIRTHKSSSLFERRLAAQEKDKYQNIVRQHMDLETIHSRLQKGSYSSCLLSFYRDLLLLFSNALVFYPKSSPESVTARELHRLLSTEIQKKTSSARTPDPEPVPPKSDTERPDSLLAKQKSSAPIIVCRKRSSFSGKPQFGQKTEDKKPAPPESKPPAKPSSSNPGGGGPGATGGEDLIKINTKERSVTGARSLRRSNTSIKGNPGKKPAVGSSAEKAPVETPKSTDQKKGDKGDKGDATGSTKKRSAVDFLKRIKRNSPAGKSKNASPADSKNGKGSGNNAVTEQKKKPTGKGAAAADKEEKSSKQSGGGGKNANKEDSSSPSKRSVGRPPKKGGDSSAAAGKRGRDSAAKEAAAASTPAIKRPRKRTRR